MAAVLVARAYLGHGHCRVFYGRFRVRQYQALHRSHPALFFSHASAETLDFLHHVIRKCGHLTEYFILSMLILRGIRAGEKGMHVRWALVTILIIAGYAALDEYPQSFVPGRTAAVGDVLIDTSGGAAALIVASLFVFLGKAREKRHRD